jgi:hypothetical protein
VETSSLHRLPELVEVVIATVVQVILKLVVEQVAKVVHRMAAGQSFSSLFACPATTVLVLESVLVDARLGLLLCTAESTRR